MPTTMHSCFRCGLARLLRYWADWLCPPEVAAPERVTVKIEE